MADDTGGLAALVELADGDPPAGEADVRGWEVIGADGGRIGHVAELLVERESRRVRFLDVDLDDDLAEAHAAAATAERLPIRGGPQLAGDSRLGDVNPVGASQPAPPAESRRRREIEVAPTAGPRPPRMGLDRDRAADDLADEGRHVLVPALGLRLDREAEQVVVPDLAASSAAELPPYRPGGPLPAGSAGPEGRSGARIQREVRSVEDGEDRFYARPDPNVAVPFPPDPGTTPAELEETDAAGLAPDPAGPRRP
jgi:hypothetical protein